MTLEIADFFLDVEDEQLARAVQESLYAESPPRQNNEVYRPSSYVVPLGGSRCVQFELIGISYLSLLPMQP